MTFVTAARSLALFLSCAVPVAALAADVLVPAKVQVLKQDPKAGDVAKAAKIVVKPPKGDAFPLPSEDPRVTGGSLRFFQPGAAAAGPDVALPAAGWEGLGKPAGSKGWKYEGAGSGSDPCKLVLVKEKLVKALCKGPGAFASPSPYDLPVGDDGAAWELSIGSDRYCAQSSAYTAADVKKDDGEKGLFKAVKAAAPASCPSCDHDVCTEGGALLGSCGTCAATVCAADPFCCQVVWDDLCVASANTLCDDCQPYGSASQAFLAASSCLLR